MEKYIKIGKIVNTHALKGDLKLNVYTENLLDIKKYPNIYLKDKNEFLIYNIVNIREAKNQIIIKLEGIDTIDKAEDLKGLDIYITQSDLEKYNPLKNDEYYIKDLIDLDVFDEEDNKIGVLKEIIELNTDVYVIKRHDQKDLLIPAIKKYIKKIDLSSRKMIIYLGGLDEI